MLLAATGLAACSGDEGTGIVAERGPGINAVRRWSDPRTWPNGRLPDSGSAVVIPESTLVVLDTTPPPLANLTIDGTLAFDDKDLELRTQWIMVHGALEIGTEARPFRRKGIITLTGQRDGDDVMGMGDKVIGVMGNGRLDLHGETRTTWLRLNATAAQGATTLTLEQAPGWRVGERIVVASSDFDPNRFEERTITAVNGATVTLDSALRWQHWGEVQTIAGRRLDERAEVALLTRNVVVRSDTSGQAQGFGGHVMVMKGGTARVEGTEFHRMGQRQLLARYPMHWHMADAVPGQYFRGNSVWKSNSRCVTVHGTDELLVERNVCHDHWGHGYFLEDGSESKNRLVGNLGMTTRVPAQANRLLPSDQRPSTFWITNPDNVVRGNVAAGGTGIGYWYALPDRPTGPSAGQPDLPRRTPLGEFTDNVSHSYFGVGLNVDDGPRADLTTEVTSYQPRAVPAQDNAPAVVAEFRNFVAYKHTDRAVWLRGSDHVLVDPVLADNHIGATFASSRTRLRGGVVIGTSANVSTTSTLGASPFITGYQFYDGTVSAEGTTFANFTGTRAGALGYNRRNSFSIDARNDARTLAFTNANQVLLEEPQPDRDGDKAALFMDRDGSVTGQAGRSVVNNTPFLLTAECVRRPEWGAWNCPHRYVNLLVEGANREAVAPYTLRRDDGVSVSLVGIPGNPQWSNMTALRERTYTVSWPASPAQRPQLFLRGAQAGDWVRLIVPTPHASVRVIRDYDSGRPIAEAASLAELDAGAGNTYWHDRTARVVHLRLQVRDGRDWAALFIEPR
ncbi:MAG: G8 domain-containing protein [Gemmatimonadaceae bacterium]|nr:G8 domain-containing protein [Gemmatimonadaceae bacterium]